MTSWITRRFFPAVVAVGLLGMPSLFADPLLGSLSLRLTDGANSVTLSDNGVCVVVGFATCNTSTSGADINGVNGVVLVSATVGTWTVNTGTGVGFPVFSQQGHMDLNSINMNTGGAGALDILLTQTDFNIAYSGFLLTFGGTFSGSAGSTVRFDAFGGLSNVAFDTTHSLGTVGPFGLGPFGGSAAGTGTSVNPYSITERIRINATGGVNFSGDAELTTVPEPTSLTLLGSGLAGLALWARRRRSQIGRKEEKLK